MRKYKNPAKNIGYFLYRWITPFFDPLHIINSLPNFPGYFKDMIAYSKMKGSEPIKLLDTYPILYEKSSGTPFDAHYFYEGVWAFKKIYAVRPKEHFDIGSKLMFAGFLFNAHRVNSPKKIIEYFKDLKLVELSAIDDQNNFIENIDIETLENSSFANGLFHFTK